MNVRFGVELEIKVPRACGLAVSGYYVDVERHAQIVNPSSVADKETAATACRRSNPDHFDQVMRLLGRGV